MSQEVFGEQIGALLGKPWPRQAVSHAEKGRRSFTASEIVALTYVIGCDISELFRLPPELDSVAMPSGTGLTRDQLSQATEVNPRSVAQLRTVLERMRDSAEHMRETSNEVDRGVREVYDELDQLLAGITPPQEA